MWWKCLIGLFDSIFVHCDAIFYDYCSIFLCCQTQIDQDSVLLPSRQVHCWRGQSLVEYQPQTPSQWPLTRFFFGLSPTGHTFHLIQGLAIEKVKSNDPFILKAREAWLIRKFDCYRNGLNKEPWISISSLATVGSFFKKHIFLWLYECLVLHWGCHQPSNIWHFHLISAVNMILVIEIY